MNRTTMGALVLVAIMLLLAGGVVLAKNIDCSGGSCVGTKRGDGINGTTGDFMYFRGDGDDTIYSGGGDDYIWDFNGGGDVDRDIRGKGNDTINVKDGDNLDEVDCGPGKDEVFADPG